MCEARELGASAQSTDMGARCAAVWELEKEKPLHQVQANVKPSLPLGLYKPTYPIVLEVSVEVRDAVGIFSRQF